MLWPVGANQFIANQLFNIMPQCSNEQRIITGYPEYETNPKKLGPEQQKVLRQIAQQIVISHSTNSPILAILVKGHADRALRKAQHEREVFEMEVSKNRAESAQQALLQEIKSLAKGNEVANLLKLKAIWVGSKELLVREPRSEAEMKMNRRVEIFWARCILPDPPLADTTKNRIDRGAELLKQKPIPGDHRNIQGPRLRCVFDKLQNKPNVEDIFLDGSKKVMLNGEGKPIQGPDGKVHFVWTPGPPKEYPGVGYNGNYGHLPQEEFTKFFDTVKRFLGGSSFARNADDKLVLDALADLDRRIFVAIEKVNDHMNQHGIASDATRRKMNDFIAKQQNNPNSIYECYK